MVLALLYLALRRLFRLSVGSGEQARSKDVPELVTRYARSSGVPVSSLKRQRGWGWMEYQEEGAGSGSGVRGRS
jgi:hypothetical protein